VGVALLITATTKSPVRSTLCGIAETGVKLVIFSGRNGETLARKHPSGGSRQQVRQKA
jgi:hypothetical protein